MHPQDLQRLLKQLLADAVDHDDAPDAGHALHQFLADQFLTGLVRGGTSRAAPQQLKIHYAALHALHFQVAAVRGEKCLELVVTFKRLQDVAGEIDRIGQTRRVRTILGVDVPNIIIPVSAGRDLVNLVETAAMQQKLLMSGGDPVFDLSERLRRRADSAKQSEPRVMDGKRKLRRVNGE